jgi:aryl-alcohol dehydrogenase-like predicted oxidoreductase
LPYGIANRVGQVSYGETAAILRQGRTAGLDTLDTASAYGESEQRLGQIGIGHWRVVSKLPAIPELTTDVAAWVRESVRSALDRLRITRLHGLLLHRPGQLLGPQGRELYQALLGLKEQGTVDKIGISIYGPDELDDVWPNFALDLVQAPYNVIDRRIATSGWLTRLHDCGTEIHVRSVFLQGLLLMDARSRPVRFNRWCTIWEEWSRWLDGQELTPAQACLSVAWSQLEIDRIVVGVDSLNHLQDILAGIDAPGTMPPASLMSDDLDLVNPSHWNAC